MRLLVDKFKIFLDYIFLIDIINIKSFNTYNEKWAVFMTLTLIFWPRQ